MKNRTFNGQIITKENCEQEEVIYISTESHAPFSDIISNCICHYGKFLSVKYYISDKPIEIETVEEKYLSRLYGKSDANYSMAYSEYTGYLWTNDEFNVGGHNMITELKNNEGSYIHLDISFSESFDK